MEAGAAPSNSQSLRWALMTQGEHRFTRILHLKGEF
jgi:hypothetical protein